MLRSLRASHAEGADIVALKVLASGLAVDRPLDALLAQAAQHVAVGSAPEWRAAAAAAADGEAPARVLARVVPPAFSDAIAACEPRALPAALEAVAGACARRHAAVSAVRRTTGYPALVAGASLATVGVWWWTTREQASALALDVLGEPAQGVLPAYLVLWSLVLVPLFVLSVVAAVRGNLPGWLRYVRGGECIDNMAELAWLEGIKVFVAADVTDRRSALKQACAFVPDARLRQRFERRMEGPPARWPVSLASASVAMAWVDGATVDDALTWSASRRQLLVEAHTETLEWMMRMALLLSAAAAVLASMSQVSVGAMFPDHDFGSGAVSGAWYERVLLVALFIWPRWSGERSEGVAEVNAALALLASVGLQPRTALDTAQRALRRPKRDPGRRIVRLARRLDAGGSVLSAGGSGAADRDIAEHLAMLYRTEDPGDRRTMATHGTEHGPPFRAYYATFVALAALVSVPGLALLPTDATQLLRDLALVERGNSSLQVPTAGLVIILAALGLSLTPWQLTYRRDLAAARVADALADCLRDGRETLAERLDAAAWGAGTRRMRARLERAAAAIRDGARVTGVLHDAGLQELAVAFASPSNSAQRLRRCSQLLRQRAQQRDRIVRAIVGATSLALAAAAIALIAGDIYGVINGLAGHAMDRMTNWQW